MAAHGGSFLEIGGKFGIYDVVRELGRGGMGAVYLVRNPDTGDELAAKVMYPESPATRDTSVRRFIREAEFAMKVEHPNLIRVYDVGRDPDTNLAYMLMDYMPGGRGFAGGWHCGGVGLGRWNIKAGWRSQATGRRPHRTGC